MRASTSKTWLALCLLDLFLLLQILAACPELHHRVHEDSDSHEHLCAIKLVASGQFLAPAADLLLEPAKAIEVGDTLPPQPFFASSQLQLAFSRGPPVYIL